MCIIEDMKNLFRIVPIFVLLVASAFAQSNEYHFFDSHAYWTQTGEWLDLYVSAKPEANITSIVAVVILEDGRTLAKSVPMVTYNPKTYLLEPVKKAVRMSFQLPTPAVQVMLIQDKQYASGSFEIRQPQAIRP